MGSALSVHIKYDTYKCPLCREFYVEPKLLPCAHLACKECLCKNRISQCPVCNLPLQTTDEDYERTVESLHTDISMQATVESVEILKNPRCDNCGSNNRAAHVCYDCDELLCGSCHRAHSKLKILENHTTECVSKLTPEKFAQGRRTFCDHEEGRVVCDKYCEVHRMAMCSTCAFNNHRDCHVDVKNLEDKLSEVKEALGHLGHTLRSSGKNLMSEIQRLDEEIKEAENITESFIKNIEAKQTKFSGSLNDTLARQKKKAERDLSEFKSQIEKKKHILSARRDILQTHLQVVSRAQETVLRKDPGGMLRTLSRQTESIEVSTALPANNHHVPFPIQVEWFASHECESNGGEMLSGGPSPCEEDPEEDRLTSSVPKVTKPPYLQPSKPGDFKKRDGGSGSTELSGEHFADEAVCIGGKSPLRLVQSSESTFRFASNKGGAVHLSPGGLTATFRGQAAGGGVVMASQPMKIHRLYQVQLERVASGTCTMTVGVVMADSPAHVNIPAGVTFWKLAVSVSPTHVTIAGDQKKSHAGKALGTLKKHDTVGVLVGKGGNLHLFVRGRDQGVVADGLLHRTCYAFFELAFLYGCTQVSALPVQVYEEVGK